MVDTIALIGRVAFRHSKGEGNFNLIFPLNNCFVNERLASILLVFAVHGVFTISNRANTRSGQVGVLLK